MYFDLVGKGNYSFFLEIYFDNFDYMKDIADSLDCWDYKMDFCKNTFQFVHQ